MASVAGKSAVWPGQWRDQQIADEYAQDLARQLPAAVSADLIALGWLAALDGTAKAAGRHRKRPRHHRQPAQQQQQQPPPQQQQPAPAQPARPSPRAFLTGAGVTAAIGAVIGGVLASLWAAAFAMGWAAAIQVLGLGGLEGDEAALAALLAAGEGRISGITQTRVRRIEQALEAAARDGTPADVLAQQISAILGSATAARLVTQTETAWGQAQAQVGAYRAAGVKSTIWQTRNDSRVCGRCRGNQAAGPWPLGKPFPSGALAPPQHPRCRCVLIPAKVGKSARTPIVSTVHSRLGTEGLWHTPDRHVSYMQQLPAYIQNTAKALMRDGMEEQRAIATAVNAVKEWAAGRAFGGRVKVTEEVREAAQRALDEWEKLRASHH